MCCLPCGYIYDSGEEGDASKVAFCFWSTWTRVLSIISVEVPPFGVSEKQPLNILPSYLVNQCIFTRYFLRVGISDAVNGRSGSGRGVGSVCCRDSSDRPFPWQSLPTH